MLPRRLSRGAGLGCCGGFGFVFAAGGVGLEDAADFIAHPAEDLHLLLLASSGVGGIVEAPVVAVELAGKHGAGLVGIAADGDDGLDVLAEELVHVLAGVRADIEPDLGHGFDSERMHITGGLGARAGDVVVRA